MMVMVSSSMTRQAAGARHRLARWATLTMPARLTSKDVPLGRWRDTRLTITSAPYTVDHTSWVDVRCDCGTVLAIRTNPLRKGTTRSCGCLAREMIGKLNRGQRAALTNAWKGGHRQTSLGYIDVYAPDHPNARKDGYLGEHRKVMSDYLGRPLEEWETVHHVNGNRHDNRIENLQLRIGKHGPGQAYACSDCGSERIHPVLLRDGQEAA